MSVHDTSLFFRGKSHRNVMIAPPEGAEGAMKVLVYGNQGKDGMGSPSNMPLAPYFRAGLFLFCGGKRGRRLCGAGEVGIYGHVPGFKQPFWDVVLIFVLLAPVAQVG